MKLSRALPQGKSNNSIDAVSIIESFWVSTWIGCFRFSHTAVVPLDEMLRQILSWKKVASGNTFAKGLQMLFTKGSLIEEFMVVN